MAMTNRGKSTDNVNHPSHYTQGYCETIYEIFDILGPEGFKSYCLGNWIKYKSRARYKNADEDLKKAEVYLGWATNGLPPLIEGKRREGDEVHPDCYCAEQHLVWMQSMFKKKTKCDGDHAGPPCTDPECWCR